MIKSKLSESSGTATDTGLKNKKISAMTFHASKGLEFDAVYIISANEGITPSASAGDLSIEEERRLFYVAMTRAKRILHISYTRSLYNKKMKVSRFVGEAVPYTFFRILKMRQLDL